MLQMFRKHPVWIKRNPFNVGTIIECHLWKNGDIDNVTHQIMKSVVDPVCSQFVIWTYRTFYGIVSRCKEV